ncbi:MAG TPA: hypothetical protein VE753_06340 [Gaiellaceae bacterium]|jgi:hypothetical protein|nr:hypothetical protein [Gaiellaceae bacterium]
MTTSFSAGFFWRQSNATLWRRPHSYAGWPLARVTVGETNLVVRLRGPSIIPRLFRPLARLTSFRFPSARPLGPWKLDYGDLERAEHTRSAVVLRLKAEPSGTLRIVVRHPAELARALAAHGVEVRRTREGRPSLLAPPRVYALVLAALVAGLLLSAAAALLLPLPLAAVFAAMLIEAHRDRPRP